MYFIEVLNLKFLTPMQMQNIGLIAKKCGMSSLVNNDGVVTPITIINIPKQYIASILTIQKNGYNAIVIAADGFAKSTSVNKPQKIMLEKNLCPVVSELKEFRLPDFVNMSEFKVGHQVNIDLEDLSNSFVDTLSVAKGKGFAGVMKKYGFKGQPATHGVSLTHRSIGSTGNRTDPGKVFKNKKMPSRMGGKNVRKQNMKIVGFDREKSLLYILGSVPGFNGSKIIIQSAIKKSIKINSESFVFNAVSATRLS